MSDTQLEGEYTDGECDCIFTFEKRASDGHLQFKLKTMCEDCREMEDRDI